MNAITSYRPAPLRVGLVLCAALALCGLTATVTWNIARTPVTPVASATSGPPELIAGPLADTGDATTASSRHNIAGTAAEPSARFEVGPVAAEYHAEGSQLSYVRLSDGMRLGTASERYSRPALSIVKLYLADHVLRNGTPAQGYQAVEMVATSDDDIADQLSALYPQAIAEVSQRYGLSATMAGDYWGNSVTSTFDMVTFVAALYEEDPVHPILVAMSRAPEKAADGYRQDFGTAVLSGVQGTKFGWANDGSHHATVSFGDDFVVAASIHGSASELTQFVRTQLTAEKEKEGTAAHRKRIAAARANN